MKEIDAQQQSQNGETLHAREHCNPHGQIMQIAFYTQDDRLFRKIDEAFAEDGAYHCVRFTHELTLIRFLERHQVALVLFDAGTTPAASQGYVLDRTVSGISAQAGAAAASQATSFGVAIGAH